MDIIGSVDEPGPTIKFKEDENIKFKSNSTEKNELKGSIKTGDSKKNKEHRKSTHFAEQSLVAH
jgi:hypothetical protein